MSNCPSGDDPKTCSEDPKACAACAGAHQENEKDKEEKAIARALKRIGQKLVVMSGKGGVGKSSVAVALALSLARRGKKVGLMDVDLHGPNVLRMLGLKEPIDMAHGQFDLPPDLFDNLRVISIEVLMRNRDTAVIWRGPLKHQLIRQFISEIEWGSLDYLVVDSPPGTGDEPMSVAQTIPDAKAVIVTTPQEISLADVRKSLNFCEKINMKVVGVVENMSSYTCPHCGKELPLFKTGGGLRTAQAAKVPFLGSLPFDPKVVEAADQGKLLDVKAEDSPFFQAFRPIVDYILETLPAVAVSNREPGVLKFALPVEDGKLSDKFGQASHFAVITVKDGARGPQELLPTPPQEAGGVPAWLDDLGVTHVIAGTLGEKAQGLLTRRGIEVIAGAPLENPEALVEKYLSQTLTTSHREHPGSCSHCSTA